jgi:hypothetical protein
VNIFLDVLGKCKPIRLVINCILKNKTRIWVIDSMDHLLFIIFRKWCPPSIRSNGVLFVRAKRKDKGCVRACPERIKRSGKLKEAPSEGETTRPPSSRSGITYFETSFVVGLASPLLRDFAPCPDNLATFFETLSFPLTSSNDIP